MEKRIKPLLLSAIIATSPIGAIANGTDIDELNREQLSLYTKECREDVAGEDPYVDEKLKGIESYLAEPSDDKLKSLMTIRFGQTFQGMRRSPCYMLPTLMYDTLDGRYIDYRN